MEGMDNAFLEAFYEFREVMKSMSATQKAALAKIRKHIEEDLAYFREHNFPSVVEAPKTYDQRIVELLRSHYVMQAAVAESLFPLRKLVLFNTWYPPRPE